MSQSSRQSFLGFSRRVRDESILSSIIAHERSLMVVVRVRLSKVPASICVRWCAIHFATSCGVRCAFDKVTDGPVSRL